MLRVTLARMLAGCSRVPFCQGPQSLSNHSAGVFHSLQGHALRPFQPGSANSGTAKPHSLWSAVFQGYLGRPQLSCTASFRTAVVAAAGSNGQGNSSVPTGGNPQDQEVRATIPGARKIGPRGPRRSSRRSTTDQPTSSPKGTESLGSSLITQGAASDTKRFIQQPVPAVEFQQQPSAQPQQQQLTQEQQQLQHSLQDQQQQQQRLQQEQQLLKQQQQALPAPDAPWNQAPLDFGPAAAAASADQQSQQPVVPAAEAPSAQQSADSTIGRPSSYTSTSTSNCSRSDSNSSSNGSSIPHAPPAARPVPVPVPVPVPAPEPNMALRSAFGVSHTSLSPPVHPVSDDVLEWTASVMGSLDVAADKQQWQAVLESWKAGMATVVHPFTQQQVNVCALPYYRHGKLVDVRYLHIVEGRLEATWLAAEACQPFMQDTALQDATHVVFVSSELDALLLTALVPEWPVIALTQQTPQWHTYDSTANGEQYAQYVQQQLALQVPEDPRRRLAGLQADISRLQQEYDLGLTRQAAGSAGGQQQQQQLGVHLPGAGSGAIGDSSSISGLQLLLGLPPDMADCRAVVALHEGPQMELLSDALASLLGPLHCRKACWPSDAFSTPDTLLLSARQAAWQAAGMEPAVSDGVATDDVTGSFTPTATYTTTPSEYPIYTSPPVEPPADLVAQYAAQQPAILACEVLQALAGPSIMSGWSLLSVHFLTSNLQPYHAGVVQCLEATTIWPMPGLGRFSDYLEAIVEYWDQTNMAQQPRSTGWPALDESYKVVPGEVTIVTGVPNSGKSEWLDALAIHLAEAQGWRFAMCSMEKKPRDHARQLLEKRAGKPMLTADYSRGVPQMTEQELMDAYAWLCRHFYVIAAGEGDMPSINWVLDKARAAKIQFGIDGLVIDPYNELDPARVNGVGEHEHVNQTMAVIRKFARDYKVAVWLVAHPRQMGNMWSGQRPGLQDISGGANFVNKADNGLVVHRDWARLKELKEREAVARGKAPSQGGKRGRKDSKTAAEGEEEDEGEEAGPDLTEFEVQISVEKVRNKSTGSRGDCVLIYDRVTGRYWDPYDDANPPDWEELLEAQARREAAAAAQQQQQQQQQQGQVQEQQGAPVGQTRKQGQQRATGRHSAAVPASSGDVVEGVAGEEGGADESEGAEGEGGGGGGEGGEGEGGGVDTAELERLYEEQERARADLAAGYDLREGRSEPISGMEY